MQRTLVFLTFILFSIFVNATDNAQDQITIKTLISKIKHSSSDDKRELMNQLKIFLRKMNQETRKKVMQDLQKSFAAQKNNQSNILPATASTTNSALQNSQQGTMRQTVTIPQNPDMQFRGGK